MDMKKPEPERERETLPEDLLPEEEKLDIFVAVPNTSTSSSANTSSTNPRAKLPDYKIVIRNKDFLLFELLTGKLIGNFPISLLPTSIHTDVIELEIGNKVISALVTYSKK